ncbi:MAG: NADH:flavin oxidoreductase [Thermaerobacter sp.]|nr:NADH:flavin oxidoreductase [Thermaerobacter sp.]
MPDLFSPLEVRGLALRNRIMMPPMASDVATEAGEVTPRHLEHYLARARSQVALLVVEHTYVRRSGRLTRTQLGLHDEALVEGFRRLVEAIRPTGARLVLQLTHAGSATTAAVAEAVPEGPSAVLHPSGKEVPRELTVADLAQIREEFAAAARRAVEAGFDGVEIHGAHGYLLNQFLSPLTNRRTDDYGGDLAGRSRFPLEVIRRVRREVGPDYPLFYRFGADDGLPGGFPLAEAVELAPRLVEAGVDLLDVSGGLIGSRPAGAPPGYNVEAAAAVRRAVTVPVAVAGGITEPAFADSLIREGKTDLVAVGRALLRDPRWALRAARELGHPLEETG